MSKIEIFGDGLDGCRVTSWMLFPNDEFMRTCHLSRAIAVRRCNSALPGEQISIDPQMLMAIANGPGLAELTKQAAEATKRGTVAGDLLSLIYEMHAKQIQEPSFGKAIESYKKFSIGKRYGDGEALKYSEQMLRNYFNEFLSVSHLWGAFRLNQGQFSYLEADKDIFHDQESLLRMLGVAKSLQEFSSTFVPKRARPIVPIIPIDEQVLIPNSIAPLNLVFRPA